MIPPKPPGIPISDDAWRRSHRYAAKRSLILDPTRRFGYGQDGFVWRTSAPLPSVETAMKVFDRTKQYIQERDCYVHLKKHGLTRPEGFQIPRLIEYDDDLLVVEMTVVQPPFIVDFGKAHVYVPLPISCFDSTDEENDEEAKREYEEREAAYIELFDGKNRWQKVKRLLSKLEGVGIVYPNPNPRDIVLGDDVTATG